MEIETLSMPAAELEDSSGTLQYILSISVAGCSVILVGLWIKGEKKIEENIFLNSCIAKLQFGCVNVPILKSPVI